MTGAVLEPAALDDVGGDTVDPAALAAFYDRDDAEVLADPELAAWHERLLRSLEAGAVRAAVPDAEAGDDTGWRAEAWIKRAILVGFRAFPTAPIDGWGAPAFDRGAYLPRAFTAEDGVRLVPGGSAVRRGAHVADGVVIMPPAYVNVGAWIGPGTMIDSHALVGSCAQVGAGVHLSAGAQVGGVLEPVGARPVVIEDDVFVGGLCGVFEGVVVGRGAVLAPGVRLTAATTIYDVASSRTWRGRVPEGAVVVPGSRPARGAFADQHGLSVYAPILVKYRDQGTDAATALEGALR